MKYDGLGRQSRWVFPSKTTPGVADQSDYEQYGYDPSGNRVSLRKRDGGMLYYHYDALDRMAMKQTPGQVAESRSPGNCAFIPSACVDVAGRRRAW